MTFRRPPGGSEGKIFYSRSRSIPWLAEPMTAMAFDTLKFAKRLKEGGFTEQQAEALATAEAELIEDNLATRRHLKELEAAVQRAIKELEAALRRDIKELDTKIEPIRADLKRDIEELRTDLKRDTKNSRPEPSAR